MAFERNWFLRDGFGGEWIVRLSRGSTVPRPSSDAGAHAVVRVLERALNPWGHAPAEPSRVFLDMFEAVAGYVALGSLRADRDDTESRRRRDTLLRDVLVRAIESGSLICEPAPSRPRFEVESDLDPEATKQIPVLPPEAVKETTWFEVRVVDESGAPISGLEMVFEASGARRSVPTNGLGKARFDGIPASFGSVRVASPKAAQKELEDRWKAFRPVALAPVGPHTLRTLRELGSALSLESEVLHTLVVLPHHQRVRLVGMHFDTNKCFLLPSAMPGIRKVKLLYDSADASHFLVVGHTDEHGKTSYNEALSLERAQSILAFLKDDAAAWDAWFSSKDDDKRWGNLEIASMLSALPEGQAPFVEQGKKASAESIKKFQSWSNTRRGTDLVVDGVSGKKTRRAIVEAYMALDHTTLPERATVVAHGCGPHQPPIRMEGQTTEDADCRRVDIFAFEGPIRPEPPGPTSKKGDPHYPQWVQQMERTLDVRAPARLSLRIWAMDDERQRMPLAPYRLRIGVTEREGHANEQGLIEEHGLPPADTCRLEWGELPPKDPRRGILDFPFERDLFTVTHSDEEAHVDRRLHNLAYLNANRAERITAFELDYEVQAVELTACHKEGRPAPPKIERQEGK